MTKSQESAPTTIKNALVWAFNLLNKEPSEAHLEAELLLSHLLQKNRAYLFSYPEQELTTEQMSTYEHLIRERVAGVPIAYLTQEREFWSLSLKVNQHTLIPRHETELLVELALQLLPPKEQLTLLDLGTGSGAIALALAKERPHWTIHACDKSESALAIAQLNAQQHQCSTIHFHHSDWFASVPIRQYDAIVANPPYIAASDPHLLTGDVRFEPQSALVSPDEGLAYLRHIIINSRNFLASKGLLLLEHGFEQKKPIAAILNRLGYNDIRSWQDIAGHDRVSGGWNGT